MFLRLTEDTAGLAGGKSMPVPLDVGIGVHETGDCPGDYSDRCIIHLFFDDSSRFDALRGGSHTLQPQSLDLEFKCTVT